MVNYRFTRVFFFFFEVGACNFIGCQRVSSLILINTVTWLGSRLRTNKLHLFYERGGDPLPSYK